ncbi:hypothetical protein Dimus_012756, partial [Dionaea muscipula]
MMHLVDRSHDEVRWIGDKNGEFTVRGAYGALSGLVPTHPWWKLIWSKWIPPR